MNREKLLAIDEKDFTTVRIVSPEGVERPFNRLLNTIIAADGNSFVALEEDAKGAMENMIVKLPEKRRRVIQKVDVKDGIATVHFVIDKQAPTHFVIDKEAPTHFVIDKEAPTHFVIDKEAPKTV